MMTHELAQWTEKRVIELQAMQKRYTPEEFGFSLKYELDRLMEELQEYHDNLDRDAHAEAAQQQEFEDRLLDSMGR